MFNLVRDELDAGCDQVADRPHIIGVRESQQPASLGYWCG